jgi:hypothetical protein
MDYILGHQLTESDIDFLNETDIEFEIIDTHGLKPQTNVVDSGWCDMTTDARIIGVNDRVIFRNVSPEDETYLTLRYTTRLKELTTGFKKIYNIATT